MLKQKVIRDIQILFSGCQPEIKKKKKSDKYNLQWVGPEGSHSFSCNELHFSIFSFPFSFFCVVMFLWRYSSYLRQFMPVIDEFYFCLFVSPLWFCSLKFHPIKILFFKFPDAANGVITFSVQHLQEENMTREVNTIKNELLSLKGAFTHLQDCHSPQTDQHAGQEENLQVKMKCVWIVTNLHISSVCLSSLWHLF